ncbi:MAG: hypothetical protein MI919_17990 [Holophagales bacterium]|nr:hypothetical protein [Holophagales bacterium]
MITPSPTRLADGPDPRPAPSVPLAACVLSLLSAAFLPATALPRQSPSSPSTPASSASPPSWASTGPASGGAAESFDDAARVTAIDLLVGFEPRGLARFTGSHRLPRDFDPGVVSVTRAGEALDVVATEPVVEGVPVATEPWRLVVAFDAAGSRTGDLRWAAGLLAERAEDLVRLGTVEVIAFRGAAVAEVLLPRTRELSVVRTALSDLALELEGQDGLADLRYGVRRQRLGAEASTTAATGRAAGATTARDSPSARADPAAGATLSGALGSERAAHAAETARVLHHQDLLLEAVADRSTGTGPRRGLIWITGGFDPDPHVYYGVDSPSGQADPEAELERRLASLAAPDLGAETRAFVRTLAAYGWITVAVQPPPTDPLRGKGRGARLGKWRFLGPAATYEGDRRPERAEAYLELARSHLGAGNLDRAADAFDRAYYYFWGDPRTKDRQAVALAGLAAALEGSGRLEEARRAFEMAEELDPSALPELGGLPPTGRLLAPRRPLVAAAAATSGRFVDSAAALGAALDDLSIRLRITYQVEGDATGEVEPVSAMWEGKEGELLRVPGWARSGAPARLDRARARLAARRAEASVGEGVAFGRQEVLVLDPLAERGDGLVVALGMKPTPEWPPIVAGGSAEGQGPVRGALRLTVVDGGDPALPPLVSQVVWPTAPGLPGFGSSPELLLRGRAVVLLWRDLESGRWGGSRVPTGLR